MVIATHGLPTNRLHVLYYDSTVDPLPDDRSEGFAEALRIATILEQRFKGSLVVVDTSKYTPEELQEAYLQAVGVSVLKKYRIRQIFGSRRHSGWLFGRGVPALLVYERNRPTIVSHLFQGHAKTILGHSSADEVYPREEGGVVVRIADYLGQFKIQ